MPMENLEEEEEVVAHDLEKGLDVFVESRTWPGINKPGGFGKVAKLNDDGTVIPRFARTRAGCFICLAIAGPCDQQNLHAPFLSPPSAILSYPHPGQQ